MGKKLNALLGRSSKTAKLRMLANLAISRIAIFRNLHSVRCSQAQSDVIQLLQQRHHERALLRVELVIKEQDTLDAFVMMENYCHLLGERADVIKNSGECPDELKEAISSLIFAASRCGGFPELQEIRHIFTSKFGKEFAASAVELRNNCSVYPKMIQRLSTKQASLETRHKLLKQIARDNGIALQLHHEEFDISRKEQVQMHAWDAASEAHTTNVIPLENHFPQAAIGNEPLSESVKARKAYNDVAAAAQHAFESAASVELSRLELRDEDRDDHSGSHHQNAQYNSLPISKTQHGRNLASEVKLGLNLAMVHPVDSASSESDDEGIEEHRNRYQLEMNIDVESEEKSLDPYNLDTRGPEVNETDDEIRTKNDRKARLRYYRNRPDLRRNALPSIRNYGGAE